MIRRHLLRILIALLTCGVSVAQDLPGVAPPLIDEVTDSVRWNSWRLKTFESAAMEEKLVLASIESRWQYDSQNLRLLSYQDPKLAEYINTKFVPIRVDSDARPDIQIRYATGGLPTVVILNSGGFPVIDPESNPDGTGVYGQVVSASEELWKLCKTAIELQRCSAGGGLLTQTLAPC